MRARQDSMRVNQTGTGSLFTSDQIALISVSYPKTRMGCGNMEISPYRRDFQVPMELLCGFRRDGISTPRSASPADRPATASAAAERLY